MSGSELADRRRVVRAAGQPFSMSDAIEGEFALPMSKSEAYQLALRDLMTDFLAAEQVSQLFSPPRRPQYNGAIEAGQGSLQTRAHWDAAR